MNILFGVTAGISIYKSLNVIRLLQKRGHDVRVIMTPNAKEFIQPILFKTISNNDVYVEDFDYRFPLAHIKLADWADVFVIAPLTANTLAKIANGIADNLLTSNFIAFEKRKILFPAMNVHMYENPVTQANMEKLSALPTIEIYEPDSGDLACGYSAKGRLPDEEFIAGVIDRDPELSLKGKKFIVTAGGTIEKVDPVRYVSNFSSGKMGCEIAKNLFRKGAEVLLITGNVSVNVPPYIPKLHIGSTIDMLTAVQKRIPDYDGLFMAAAPADYRIKQYAEKKIKKEAGLEALTLEFAENPDILATVAQQFPDKFYIGFALETDDYQENAKQKLKKKKLDYIILNPLTKDFNPLGSDVNKVTLLSADGEMCRFPEEESDRIPTKAETAEWLIRKTLFRS